MLRKLRIEELRAEPVDTRLNLKFMARPDKTVPDERCFFL